jgi:hypothetical protein
MVTLVEHGNSQRSLPISKSKPNDNAFRNLGKLHLKNAFTAQNITITSYTSHLTEIYYITHL